MTTLSKNQEVLRRHLDDMRAVIDHVESAMRTQANQIDEPSYVAPVVRGIADTLRDGREELDTVLDTLGGSNLGPVKGAAATAAGLVAGLYNRIRDEGAARALRDDYVALQWVAVCYGTLHTTALALGEDAIASLAYEGGLECAQAAAEVATLIPQTVFAELEQDDDELTITSGADVKARIFFEQLAGVEGELEDAPIYQEAGTKRG